MDEGWYKLELRKLIEIARETRDEKKPLIGTDYVLEKLERIYYGTGISVHPVISNACRRFMQEENKDCGHICVPYYVENGNSGMRCIKCGTPFRILEGMDDGL
jgi:hypothetical protein